MKIFGELNGVLGKFELHSLNLMMIRIGRNAIVLNRKAFSMSALVVLGSND